MRRATMKRMVGMMTLMQTRNVSQSVYYRVVGMTWVINAGLISAT
jgi:hypothetical protein